MTATVKNACYLFEEIMNAATISKVMAHLGKKGGKKGGASKSKAKRESSAANLAKARAARWPQNKEKHAKHSG